MKLPCIFLMGPTAAGKTDLAILLTQHFPCDIISVDSAMVYRGMDIGTAKPVPSLLVQTPHRLIDIREPTDAYSAAQFCQDALKEIQQIQLQERIPLLVGGTGLYFRSLQHGLSDLPSADPHIRQQLNQQALTMGWESMHQRLAQIDPQAAQRIHPNDPQRIQRALEVYEATGYTMTQWYQKSVTQTWDYPTIKLIIAPQQRHILHERIQHRFILMLEQGFVAEVESLIKQKNVTVDLPAMRAVGYRQVWQYLLGELNETELTERSVIATRQLAKRQLTWLRAEQNAHWFDSQEPCITEKILHFIATELEKYYGKQ